MILGLRRHDSIVELAPLVVMHARMQEREEELIGQCKNETDMLLLVLAFPKEFFFFLYFQGMLFVLFLDFPLCGFSARVVAVLQSEGDDFSSVNVLDYPEIREGVKKFA